MDLSVGEPVMNRETSELSESDARNPKTIKTMPTTRSAIAMLLFMTNPQTCYAALPMRVKLESIPRSTAEPRRPL
jgi:hypothetical protein